MMNNYSIYVSDYEAGQRDERDKWQELFSDALQSDLENGVKWLNEEASTKFKQNYPELNKVLAQLAQESYDQ